MYEWTVMIYMAGDNNLDANGVSDLREIKRVGSTPEVAIIAQFDRSGDNGHTKRYHLHHFSTSPSIAKDEVDDLDETDTGSKEEFIKFLRWGIDNFTAKRYLVIIWGHGSGALDDDIFDGEGRTLRRRGRRFGVFNPLTRAAQPLSLTLSPDSIVGGLKESEVFTRLTKMATTAIATDDQAKSFRSRAYRPRLRP